MTPNEKLVAFCFLIGLLIRALTYKRCTRVESILLTTLTITLLYAVGEVIRIAIVS